MYSLNVLRHAAEPCIYTVDGIHGLCIWPAGCTECQNDSSNILVIINTTESLYFVSSLLIRRCSIGPSALGFVLRIFRTRQLLSSKPIIGLWSVSTAVNSPGASLCENRVLLITWSTLSAGILSMVITGSIARRARRRYLIYSDADFELFCPTEATRSTDGDEIWHGGGEQRSPPPCQI